MVDRSPDIDRTEDVFDPRSRSVRSHDHTTRDRLAQLPLLRSMVRSGRKPASLRASVGSTEAANEGDARFAVAGPTRATLLMIQARETGADNTWRENMRGAVPV